MCRNRKLDEHADERASETAKLALLYSATATQKKAISLSRHLWIDDATVSLPLLNHIETASSFHPVR